MGGRKHSSRWKKIKTNRGERRSWCVRLHSGCLIRCMRHSMNRLVSHPAIQWIIGGIALNFAEPERNSRSHAVSFHISISRSSKVALGIFLERDLPPIPSKAHADFVIWQMYLQTTFAFSEIYGRPLKWFNLRVSRINSKCSPVRLRLKRVKRVKRFEHLGASADSTGTTMSSSRTQTVVRKSQGVEIFSIRIQADGSSRMIIKKPVRTPSREPTTRSL